MIFLLINRFFNDPQVPTGRMLADVASECLERGHTVVVLTSGSSYAGPPAAGGGGPAPGLQVRVLFTFGPRALRWALFWVQAVPLALLTRWDACLALTDPPFLAAFAPLDRVVRGRSRRRYLWAMDLYPEAVAASGLLAPRGWAMLLLRRFSGWILRGLDGVIALDDAQAARLRATPRCPQAPGYLSVLPPWDRRSLTEPAEPADEILGRLGLHGKRVALYAGNLGEAHEFGPFVAAARHLWDAGRQDWVFVFACRGARRKALEMAAQGLPNVLVRDYLPPEDTRKLLWAAAVHLITLSEAWTGVCVPSKLYGILPTGGPVLFLGSPNGGTAVEVIRYGVGRVLPLSATGPQVAEHLQALGAQGRRRIVVGADGPSRVADVLAGAQA